MNRGRGSVVDSKFLCSEYDSRVDQAANETNSWECDHSCNTRNVTPNGKHLEEVDAFDIDGIQGRHIAEYSEQRKPKGGNVSKLFSVGWCLETPLWYDLVEFLASLRK